ncbi:DMT family transporter [uncultured Megasphaera sp.]|uniref:DMT family transporter n=1 Tax=uncultured Megasphaera sp. TaxID=165188 RepID=UPI002659CC31|nr:DMT family transporter [uncultured Megasphaera sp.]
MKQLSRRTAMILADGTLLVVAAIWGGGFIAAKEALATMTPFSILASRFLLSSAVMFALFGRRILHCSRNEVKYGTIIGCIQFIAFVFQLEGLQTTTVEKQSFLVTAYVLFVPFLSWLATRRPIRLLDLACAVLALIGLALLCLHSGMTSLVIGDVLSLGFALFFAIQIVYVGNFVHDADIVGVTFFQLLLPGLLALPFLDMAGLAQADTAAVTGIAYLVLLNTAFAFSAQNIAQQYTSDTHASLLISFESVFGFVFAVWFYGHAVTLQELAGCACMLTAVILSNVHKKT